MRKFLLGILPLLIFPTYLWGKTPSFIPAQSVALVFSSNVHGEAIPASPGSSRQDRESGTTLRGLGASYQLLNQSAGDGGLSGNGRIGLDRPASYECH